MYFHTLALNYRKILQDNKLLNKVLFIVNLVLIILFQLC